MLAIVTLLSMVFLAAACFKADLKNSGDPDDAENAANILGLLGIAAGNEDDEEVTTPPPDNACVFDANQYGDGCVFGP